MKLGIKIAPGNAWKSNIEATRPRMVEVWYNASKPADYDEMLAYLSTRDIDVGLHYWGTLPSQILTNISYPDSNIAKLSLELMYGTIDVAAKYKCVYVNVHPDLYSLLSVNFDTMDIRVASEQANRKTMEATFIERITALHTYARSKNVILTVETVPMRDTPSWKPDRDRSLAIDIHQMPMDVFLDLAAHGISIANDFGHTACNMISNDRGAIWTFLYDTTRTLAPYTRLIHLGCIVPPYNGVDFHDSLDNPMLDTEKAIPNKNQMQKLLKLFDNRDDVWILVEPKENHVKNFSLAQKIIASI